MDSILVIGRRLRRPRFLKADSRRRKRNLRQLWNDKESEVRFAWEWAALGDEQRKQLLGWPTSWESMERIMRWAVTAIIPFWQACDVIYWDFTVDGKSGEFTSEFEDFYSGLGLAPPPLAGWAEFLIQHFIPHWRADLFRRHPCVSRYVNGKYYDSARASVRVGSCSTAHEYLEAKLALRDWLRDVGSARRGCCFVGESGRLKRCSQFIPALKSCRSASKSSGTGIRGPLSPISSSGLSGPRQCWFAALKRRPMKANGCLSMNVLSTLFINPNGKFRVTNWRTERVWIRIP